MFMCIYKPPAQNKQYFLGNLSMIADHYSSIYDNHIILEDFMKSLNLFNIIK